jgi:hypothetical protein
MNKNSEINNPMMKKFEKMKSLSNVLLFPFLGIFDFGFEDGRTDCAQFPPRLDEEGMIYGDEKSAFFSIGIKKKCFFFQLG